MNIPLPPSPTLGRMMVFIDGENLVARYQAMIESGRVPSHEVNHHKDVFAWSHGAIWSGLNIVLRATYYTYVVGDEKKVQQAAEQIGQLTYAQYYVSGTVFSNQLGNSLYPKVFRKIKNRKGKGVDIQMTVDVLCNTYQNNLDTVYLITGDGDYAPLIAECQRQGKQVFLAALSSGLSPDLKLAADRFIDIDNCFVKPLGEK